MSNSDRVDIKDLVSLNLRLVQEIKRIATVDFIEIEEYVDSYSSSSSASATVRRKLTEIKSAADKKGGALTPEYAEVVVYLALKVVFPGEDVDYHIGSTKFPDIAVGNSGFEVKTISSGQGWLGNSVLQNDPGFGRIYAVSFSGDASSVEVARYGDLIAGIKVTHKPRFFLIGESDFSFQDKFGLTVEDFLSISDDERIRMVMNYLREEGSDDAWYNMGPEGPEFSDGDVLAIEILLKGLKANKPRLPEDRDKVRIQAFALKPELSICPPSWDGLRSYVLKEFKYFGGVKDAFTAGGKENDLPRVIYHFDRLLDDIGDYLCGAVGEDALNEWKEVASRRILDRIDQKRNGLTRDQAGKIILRIKDLKCR